MKLRLNGYHAKGQERSGSSWTVPCSTQSAAGKVRECWLGTAPADQASSRPCWSCHVTLALLRYITLILMGMREGEPAIRISTTVGGIILQPPSQTSLNASPLFLFRPLATSLGCPHLPNSHPLHCHFPVSLQPTMRQGQIDEQTNVWCQLCRCW